MGRLFNTKGESIMPVEFNASWIQSGLNTEAIKFAEEFGESLAQTLSTSQIRNVFGEVRRIQQKIQQKGITNSFDSEVLLLKPKLSYARARANAPRDLESVLSSAIDAIFQNAINPEQKFQRFENFANFFEAILAYHRAYGGK
jgi:CRISPR-associated protein Csm2